MKNYSAVRKIGNRQYRYNYTDQLMEFVTNEDFAIDEETNEVYKITYQEYKVVSSIGLSIESVKESGLQYWMENYHNELDEELRYLKAEFFAQ